MSKLIKVSLSSPLLNIGCHKKGGAFHCRYQIADLRPDQRSVVVWSYWYHPKNSAVCLWAVGYVRPERELLLSLLIHSNLWPLMLPTLVTTNDLLLATERATEVTPRVRDFESKGQVSSLLVN